MKSCRPQPLNCYVTQSMVSHLQGGPVVMPENFCKNLGGVEQRALADKKDANKAEDDTKNAKFTQALSSC